jgi:hypothetical protein
VAASLGIGAVDYVNELLRGCPRGAAMLPISAATEEQRLDQIANDATGSDCVLVCNLDLALAKLTAKDREWLWANLRNRFSHRRRALVLAVPKSATNLLPQGDEMRGWECDGRVAQMS